MSRSLPNYFMLCVLMCSMKPHHDDFPFKPLLGYRSINYLWKYENQRLVNYRRYCGYWYVQYISRLYFILPTVAQAPPCCSSLLMRSTSTKL